MKKLLSFAISVTFIGSSFCQHSPATINTIEQLKDSIARIMAEENVAGLMLGIAMKDSIIFSGGFGYADVKNKKEVDGKTLFRMGSITKMFISLGIMKLIDEGKLSLNDELRSVAPEVPFQNQWESLSPVRIVHLLEHTTGFDDVKLNNMYSFDSTENSGFTMVAVHRHSLISRWKPGERTAYANPNYAILGYILQKILGKSYDEYLRDIILTPLAMDHSNFNTRSKHPDRESKEYIVQHENTIEVPHVTLLSGPQGALWSCADDMVRFLQLFLKNGNPIFQARTIKEIETSHSSLAAKHGLVTGYALGNRNCFLTSPYPFRGHDGLTGTFFSGCYYSRKLNVGFVISSNSNVPNHKIENLIVNFLEHNWPKKNRTMAPLDQGNIRPFLGWYQFESPRNEISAFIERLQNVCYVFMEHGELYSKPLIGKPTKLIQTKPNAFAYENMNTPLVLFTSDGDKNVMSIGGSYYEQKTMTSVLFSRSVILLALAVMLMSAVYGAIAIVLWFRKKLSTYETTVRLAPTLATISLAWGIQNLLHVQQFTYKLAELHTITFRSLAIFAGTGIFAISTLGYTIITVTKIVGGGKKPWSMLLFTAALLAVFFLLAVNGWIGLRTWAQ